MCTMTNYRSPNRGEVAFTILLSLCAIEAAILVLLWVLR